jgi:hypothetical protein
MSQMVKRVMLLVMMVVMMLVPATAVAQETTTAATPEGVVVGAPAEGPLVPLLTAPPAQVQAPAPRVDAGGRRRPSMVGYVNDSTIRSQFRIRFDAGYEIGSADRAEFFYGKCGCYAGLPADLDIFDPDAPGPGPGILSNGNFQQLYLLGEYGFMENRASLFAELPFRWLKPQEFIPGTGGFDDASGLSDVRVGAKLNLMSTDNGQATALLQFGLPSGDSEKGLGTNHGSIEPALLIGQRVGDRAGVEAQFGGIFPVGGSAGLPTANEKKFAGRVLYYGLGTSYDVFSSDTVRVAPVVELVGWRVMSGFMTVCEGAPCFAEADGNIVNLKIGARVVMQGLSSIYVGYGKGLTDRHWYDEIFRLEFRRYF